MIKGFRTVIVEKSSFLEYSLGYLTIRSLGDKVKILLDEVHTIILENIQSSLSVYLLKEFVERNITVLICDDKHLPIGDISPLYGNFESPKKLETQLKFDSETKLNVWKKIIEFKITNQINNLQILEDDYNSSKLQEYKEELLKPNLSLDEIQIIEAKSANNYFSGFIGSWHNRKDKDEIINKQLNYIYAILLATTSRYICALGYKTELGLFHKSQTNKYNLSSDIMEPFRPLCDLYLLSLENEDEFNKSKIANILNEKVIVQDCENYFNNSVEIFVQSVFRALVNNDISQIHNPKLKNA